MNNIFTEEAIAEALKISHGRMSPAATIVGCNRNTIQNRIEKSEYLKSVQREAMLSCVDEVEDELYNLCMGRGAANDKGERGQVPESSRTRAIACFLAARGKGRGYGIKSVFKFDDGENKKKRIDSFLTQLSDAIERGGPPITDSNSVDSISTQNQDEIEHDERNFSL